MVNNERDTTKFDEDIGAISEGILWPSPISTPRSEEPTFSHVLLFLVNAHSSHSSVEKRDYDNRTSFQSRAGQPIDSRLVPRRATSRRKLCSWSSSESAGSYEFVVEEASDVSGTFDVEQKLTICFNVFV